MENQAEDAALGVLFDPEAAEAAHKTGVGKTITLGLGGEPALGDQPFEGTFTIENLSDGNLTVKGPIDAGSQDKSRSHSVFADRWRSSGCGVQ